MCVLTALVRVGPIVLSTGGGALEHGEYCWVPRDSSNTWRSSDPGTSTWAGGAGQYNGHSGKREYLSGLDLWQHAATFQNVDPSGISAWGHR